MVPPGQKADCVCCEKKYIQTETNTTVKHVSCTVQYSTVKGAIGVAGLCS